MFRASLPRFVATPPHSVVPEPMLADTNAARQLHQQPPTYAEDEEEELESLATFLATHPNPPHAGPGPVCEGRIRINVAGMNRRKKEVDKEGGANLTRSQSTTKANLTRSRSTAAAAAAPSALDRRASLQSSERSSNKGHAGAARQTRHERGMSMRTHLDRLSSFQSSISAISDDVTSPAAKGWEPYPKP